MTPLPLDLCTHSSSPARPQRRLHRTTRALLLRRPLLAALGKLRHPQLHRRKVRAQLVQSRELVGRLANVRPNHNQARPLRRRIHSRRPASRRAAARPPVRPPQLCRSEQRSGRDGGAGGDEGARRPIEESVRECTRPLRLQPPATAVM